MTQTFLKIYKQSRMAPSNIYIVEEMETVMLAFNQGFPLMETNPKSTLCLVLGMFAHQDFQYMWRLLKDT